MALKWVLEHQFVFLRALLFIMMDLTGEVSSGAVDLAKANMDKMLVLCCSPIDPTPDNQPLIEAQKKSLNEITNELVRQVTSPNTYVREQVLLMVFVNKSCYVFSRCSRRSLVSILTGNACTEAVGGYFKAIRDGDNGAAQGPPGRHDPSEEASAPSSARQCADRPHGWQHLLHDAQSSTFHHRPFHR